MAIVTLEKVSKSFWIGDIATRAIRDVSLVIEDAEFTALVGPSGSGKTTLLQLIGCLDKPTSGRILFDGRDVTKLSGDALADLRRHKIGFIFQYYNLIPVLNAYENVELPLLLAGESNRHQRVIELLEVVGLGAKAKNRPFELSGGEMQRVAIARAMATNPKVILADEPTGNIDSVTTENLITLMRGLNQERGITFFFASHDPLVIQKARRRVYLQDGSISQIEEEPLGGG